MPDSGRAAVLLDIDGTLIDSTYHHAVAWQRAFDTVGYPLPLWRIHRSVGMGGDRLVAAVGGDRLEERHGGEVRKLWREEYAAIRHEVYPLPGATDLVRELSSQGYVVALASSGDPQFAREAVATLGVGDVVAVLTSAEDAEASKPDPDLVEQTLAQLPDVRRAVLVGDTPYDVESASRAGLRCLAVRSGGYSEAELRDAGAALVRDDPSGLRGLDLEEYLASPAR